MVITERAANRREMIEMRVRTDLANAEAAATRIEPPARQKVAGLGLTEAGVCSLRLVTIDDSEGVSKSMHALMSITNEGEDPRVDPQLIVLPENADPPCHRLRYPGYKYQEWARQAVCSGKLNGGLIEDVALEIHYIQPEQTNPRVGKWMSL